MSQQKSPRTLLDDSYLKQMGEFFLSLSIDELAMVLRNPVSQDDAMEAAYRMPELMEHVYQAVDVMPSSLTPEEERDAVESGESLTERMLAAWSSPITRAFGRIAAILHKPWKTVEAMSLGWSDPSLVSAMAATGTLELNAELSRGGGGQVHSEINRFGVATISGEFDHPDSVIAVLIDITRNEVVPVVIGGESRPTITIHSRMTLEGLVSLHESAQRRDLALFVFDREEKTK